MPNDDNSPRAELSKVHDNGINNNYSEWRMKSYFKLREWGLLKYIEGPTSVPPYVPPLREKITHHGVDDDGNVSTLHVLGNEVEYDAALALAKPWMEQDDIALSRITAAVLGNQCHLVINAKHAKEA